MTAEFRAAMAAESRGERIHYDGCPADGMPVDVGRLLSDIDPCECRLIFAEHARAGLVARLRSELAAAQQRLHRHEHGTTIEGDHVCAAELWRANVKSLIEEVRAADNAHRDVCTIDALGVEGFVERIAATSRRWHDAVERLLAATAKEDKADG